MQKGQALFFHGFLRSVKILYGFYYRKGVILCLKWLMLSGFLRQASQRL
jgi:hypothetical protein